LPRLFNRFYQVKSSHTREQAQLHKDRSAKSAFDRAHSTGQEGTGIGLALTKEIVELHYGEIHVMSEEGKGAEFIVTLPLGKEHLKENEIVHEGGIVEASDLAQDRLPVADIAEHDTDELTPAQPVRTGDEEIILIVEDNSEVRAFIGAQLSTEYGIIEAADGAAGLEAALEAVPDLIISDVMMPKLDGYELCGKLKSDERTSHIPVILLTARASGESRIAGLETGADDYLTKPFDSKELQVRVKNLIEQRRKLRERFRREVVLKPGEIAITSMDEQFLNRVKEVIEKHLGEEEFSVEDLAAEAGMSRVQLHRKLKALTDQSAGQFILSMRLQRAADLINQNAGTIAEVAYMTGFNTPNYFAKCFRKQFGCSPSEYKMKF
jgi:DNA-binding response OmpR family regulator